MSRYAVVDETTSVCVNVIIWDGIAPGIEKPGFDYILLAPDSPVSIGWTWDNGVWIPESLDLQ